MILHALLAATLTNILIQTTAIYRLQVTSNCVVNVNQLTHLSYLCVLHSKRQALVQFHGDNVHVQYTTGLLEQSHKVWKLD